MECQQRFCIYTAPPIRYVNRFVLTPCRAAGYDTFCPVSKFIPKKDVEHPEKLTLWLAVNGDERQRGTTADMLHPIEAILAHASACMTLEPGDLVLTGTPEGVGPLVHGDTITAGIEGVVDVTFSVRTTDSS